MSEKVSTQGTLGLGTLLIKLQYLKYENNKFINQGCKLRLVTHDALQCTINVVSCDRQIKTLYDVKNYRGDLTVTSYKDFTYLSEKTTFFSTSRVTNLAINTNTEKCCNLLYRFCRLHFKGPSMVRGTCLIPFKPLVKQ